MENIEKFFPEIDFFLDFFKSGLTAAAAVN